MTDALETGAPAHIGRYRIIRRLAAGTHSEVLLAIAEGPYGFERAVIIKRMLPGRTDDSSARILAREAVAYARLNHPAVVRLYDFYVEGGEVALVLEYVNGVALGELLGRLRVRGERFDDAASFFIASRIFSALAAAHEARDPLTGEFSPVIHRHVTPSNVLVPWDGFVKLVDFGAAKLSGVSGDSRGGSMRSAYGYMAPEQVAGEAVTVRTDVYQASLIFYELLVGAPAFPTHRVRELELLEAMAAARIEPLHTHRSDLPTAIVDAIRRGLEPHPDARTITAGEMADILRVSTPLERGRAVLSEKLAELSTPPLEWDAPSQTISRSKDTLPNLEARPRGGTPAGSDATASQTSETIRPDAILSAETVRPPAETPPDAGPGQPEAPAAPEGWSLPSPPWLRRQESTPDDIEALLAVSASAPGPAAAPIAPAPRPVAPFAGAPAVRGAPSPVPSRPPTTGATMPAARFHARSERPSRGMSPWVLGALGFLMAGGSIVIGFVGVRWIAARRSASVATVSAPTAAPSSAAGAPAVGSGDPSTRARGASAVGSGGAAPSAAGSGGAGPSSAASVESAPASAGASSGTTAPASATPPAAVEASADPPAASHADPSRPAPAATTGTIRTTHASAGHRVFIDGRLAASGGDAREVKCGKHTVRVGSRGANETVDVPCGGEVTVDVASGAGTK